MPWHERSPAQHALFLARASLLPLTDGLFVCNSHIGMDVEEAMTHIGRRDGAVLFGGTALPRYCPLPFILHTPMSTLLKAKHSEQLRPLHF